MAKSIKTNLIYSTLNTLLGVLYPLITIPYVSRVLQPEGFGLYNFLNSFIAYIVLFANIGISVYATKEVAKIRDDKDKRSQLTVEIFSLSILTMLIAFSSVFVLISFVDKIHEQKELFLIMSLIVVFQPLGVNWFYQAMEDFEYVTIRSLIVKVIAFVLLFVFVRSKNDLIPYAMLVVFASCSNNLCNIIRLRKYISFKKIRFSELNIIRHLKPCLVLFVLDLLISIYTNMDILMLGFFKTDTEVGYYTIGVKITHLLLAIISTIGMTLLPRFSYLLKEGLNEEFNRLCVKSMNLCIGISLPIVFGLIAIANPVIPIVFGYEYMNSIAIVQIMSSIILIAGITNVLGIQILLPKGKEKIVIYSTLAAAIVNFILNMILIPVLSGIGAAISTVVAELVVFIVQFFVGFKFFPNNIFSKQILDFIFGSLIMSVFLVVFRTLFIPPIWSVLLCVTIGALLYFIYLRLKQNELAMTIQGIVIKFVNR